LADFNNFWQDMFQTNLVIKRGCPPHLTCVNAQPWKTGNLKIHDLGVILVSICRYKSTFAIICQALVLLAIARSSFIYYSVGKWTTVMSPIVVSLCLQQKSP
jgi:CHASE2 domain-containing sensor protein